MTSQIHGRPMQSYDGREFSIDASLTERQSAVWHARRAEALLADVRTGTFHMTPVHASVAAVHAHLALVWATLATNDT